MTDKIGPRSPSPEHPRTEEAGFNSNNTSDGTLDFSDVDKRTKNVAGSVFSSNLPPTANKPTRHRRVNAGGLDDAVKAAKEAEKYLLNNSTASTKKDSSSVSYESPPVATSNRTHQRSKNRGKLDDAMQAARTAENDVIDESMSKIKDKESKGANRRPKDNTIRPYEQTYEVGDNEI